MNCSELSQSIYDHIVSRKAYQLRTRGCHFSCISDADRVALHVRVLQRHYCCPGPSDCSVESTRAPSGNQEQETRQCSPEPIPCCSFQPPQSVDNNNAAVFSPELIRRLPKAPPRLIGHTKARKRKTAVLTDTPEKNALAKEQASKKKKKESETKKKFKGKGTGRCKGNGKQTKKPTNNRAKRRVLQDDDSSDVEQKWFCIIKFVVMPILTLPLENNGLNAENVRIGPICNVLKMKKTKHLYVLIVILINLESI
ncbi:uncharacterized protein LOC113508724 [Trichoplusia ni]|uniref:Uncharacterized protein LOC113508724 n=1 Tax=Trichoplusia ni TaxID=7111 RepID=A0A7E5X4M5_TRINI|nr:uncharacterized protein LOC113508724 [Trichoplusia ni]